jgi:4-amino-4-deoxy-L-arabinose transferase-like glycosyltransferase
MSSTILRRTATSPSSSATDRAQDRPTRVRALLHGRDEDPAWARPLLLVLLVGTGLLYLWNLSSSGDANNFYASAVQAGSENWKAWFFGSLDSSNAITVDKPPAALWVMGLSARLFGYNSWSMLAPQALEGVLAVALLHASVRRVAGPAAGLLAGAALALTPAAVLIFRFNNPDALLLLLLVAATYCITRAVEAGATRWVVLAGVAIGLGFLTKSGQALLVLPALGAAHLFAGPRTLLRRFGQLVLGLLAIIVSAGWWIGAVALWPAADRPYIGGSTDNSALELAFGYNGLGRLFGGSGNGGGGGGATGGSTGFGGSTGLGRMFAGEFGLEISWLLPAALIFLVALGWVSLRAARRDRVRAALVMWGGSLLVTAGVFSYMQGTIHPYYSVALAPSIAALVGLGSAELWRRGGAVAHLVLAVVVAASAGWALVLLRRNDTATAFQVLVAALAVLALGGIVLRATGARLTRRLAPAILLATVLAVSAPTAAWAAQTAATVHTGSIPTAVSTGSSGSGSGGQMGGGGSDSTSSALTTALQKTTSRWAAATVGSQGAASLMLDSDTAVMAIGGFTGSDASPTLAQFKAYVAAGDIHYFVVSSGGGTGGGTAPTGSDSSTSSSSSSASADRPTPPSGKSGTAPTGTPPGETGSGAGGGSSNGTGSAITAWVKANFTTTTIGGQTVYDLTNPK